MASDNNNIPTGHGDGDDEEEEEEADIAVVEGGGEGRVPGVGGKQEEGSKGDKAEAEKQTPSVCDLCPLVHLNSSSPSCVAAPPPLALPATSNSKALIPFTGSYPGFPFPPYHHQLLSFKAPNYHHRSALQSSSEPTPSDNKLPIKASADANLQIDDEKKQETREHKKRSKNWSRSETLTLIRLRTELAPRFAKGGRKIDLWDEIAESLQKGPFFRDAQQCRDKWEKLMAGYKEVRDGQKHKDDNPYYDDLHPLLSGRILKRERGREEATIDQPSVRMESTKTSTAMDAHHNQDHHDYKTLPVECHHQQPFKSRILDGHQYHETHRTLAMDGHHQLPATTAGHHYQRFGTLVTDSHPSCNDEDDALEEGYRVRKQRRASKFLAATDLHAVQTLLESIIARQQRFFQELLDAMERKEELREQMRQEREEKWRAEERAQREFFCEAMQILTQKLRSSEVVGPSTMVAPSPLVMTPSVPSVLVAQTGLKKRSKNWKRVEVLQLIKLRAEMEDKFATSNKRAVLWEDLAQMISMQGVKRDAKQCREKWDKLMSEFKDVGEGKKDRSDSPYFLELKLALAGRSERQDDAVCMACSKQDELQGA